MSTENPALCLNGIDCDLEISRYAHTYGQVEGGIALALVASENNTGDDVFAGEPMAHLTVNISGLKAGQLGIKDYSENEGVLKMLEDAGLVVDTGFLVFQGHAQIPVTSITPVLQTLIDARFPDKAFNASHESKQTRRP